MIRYLLIVHGKVQGVGFRYFTAMKAMQYKISGYCRNLSNGNVQIEAQGNSQNVSSFISAIKAGNGFSQVDEIEINEIPAVDKCTKYEIM